MQNRATRTLSLFLFLLVTTTVVQVIQGQQAPFYKAVKFENVSYRQNLCERQWQIFLDELPLPQALQGLNLSVVVTNYKDEGSKPFFALNSAGVIDVEQPGLFVVIMDELALRAGFSWRQSFGVVDPMDATIDGNLTWTDLLVWETRTYDIALGKWDRTLPRIKSQVDFPEGWFDASIILVESRGLKDSQKIWSFLSPFRLDVWFAIGITVIATGLLYSLLDVMNHESDEKELDKQPDAAVFYGFLAMTGHFELHPTTTSSRLLGFSLTFFSLLVASAYTANLVSFLVVRKTPVFTVTSIAEAVKFNIPLCLPGGVALDEYLTTNYPDGNFVRKKTEYDALLALFDGECQVASIAQSSYDVFRRTSAVNGDCSLSWFGRVEQIVPSGLATIVDNGVLCTSLIGSVLDYHLLEMKSDGFIRRAWEDHLQRVGDQYCTDTTFEASGIGGGGNSDGGGSNINNNNQDDDIKSLGMHDLAGMFVLHAVICALSLGMACLALARHNLKQQRELSDPRTSDDPDVTVGVSNNNNDDGDPTTATETHHHPNPYDSSFVGGGMESSIEDCCGVAGVDDSKDPLFPSSQSTSSSSGELQLENKVNTTPDDDPSVQQVLDDNDDVKDNNNNINDDDNEQQQDEVASNEVLTTKS